MNDKPNKSLGGLPLADKMRRIKAELEEQAVTNENVDKQVSVQADSSRTSNINVDNTQIEHKLFISGRLDRKKNTYTAKPLVLFSGLDNELKRYCRGPEIAILNYIIKLGLDAVKKLEKPLMVDISDIEREKN